MVAISPARAPRKALHPLHAILLAFPLPLFLAALLSDLAYAASFHVQWANFAQWLIAGGSLMGGFALVAAVIEVRLDAAAHNARSLAYVMALLAAWVIGVLNA